MLTSLMDNRGHVVTRDRLYDDVWDDEVDINSNALDVHMSRLRQHLAGSRVVTIKTMRGVGYRLEQQAHDDPVASPRRPSTHRHPPGPGGGRNDGRHPARHRRASCSGASSSP